MLTDRAAYRKHFRVVDRLDVIDHPCQTFGETVNRFQHASIPAIRHLEDPYTVQFGRRNPRLLLHQSLLVTLNLLSLLGMAGLILGARRKKRAARK